MARLGAAALASVIRNRFKLTRQDRNSKGYYLQQNAGVVVRTVIIMHAYCPRLLAAFTAGARLRLPASLKAQPLSSDDIAASLTAPLFNRLASLVVAHGAPLLLATFLTFRTGAAWPLYFLTADLTILLARVLIVLWVRRKGAINPTELLRAARPYFVVGIAWSMLTETFCYLCLTVQGDEASRLLSSTLALGNMSQGLTLYDANDVLQVVNPQFHEILGLPAETIRPGDSSADVAAKLKAWAISDAVARQPGPAPAGPAKPSSICRMGDP